VNITRVLERCRRRAHLAGDARLCDTARKARVGPIPTPGTSDYWTEREFDTAPVTEVPAWRRDRWSDGRRWLASRPLAASETLQRVRPVLDEDQFCNGLRFDVFDLDHQEPPAIGRQIPRPARST